MSDFFGFCSKVKALSSSCQKHLWDFPPLPSIISEHLSCLYPTFFMFLLCCQVSPHIRILIHSSSLICSCLVVSCVWWQFCTILICGWCFLSLPFFLLLCGLSLVLVEAELGNTYKNWIYFDQRCTSSSTNLKMRFHGNFLIEADKIFSFTPNFFQETICSRKVPILAPDTKFKPMFGSESVWFVN